MFLQAGTYKGELGNVTIRVGQHVLIKDY